MISLGGFDRILDPRALLCQSKNSIGPIHLRGVQKLHWQDFAHYWPTTLPLVDICEGIPLLK